MDKADQLLEKLKEMFPQFFGSFKFSKSDIEETLDRLKSDPDLRKNDV